MNANQRFRQSSSNLILDRKEFALLLHSQAIDQIPWLKPLLLEKEVDDNPCFTQMDSTNLSAEKQRFLTSPSLTDLVNVSADEWKNESNDFVEDKGKGNKKEWERCDLCNTHIRYVFIIINKLNGNRLKVGSRCILHFGINIGDKNVSQLIREARKIRHFHELELEIPNLRSLVQGWNKQLDSYPVLIPDEYDESYRALGKKFRECFDRYADSKSKQVDFTTTVNELRQKIRERDHLVKKMDEYSKAHQNEQFVVTREIVKWAMRLDTREYQLVIKSMKRDGHITAFTAHRITEPGFMHSIAPNLNDKLGNIGLKLRSIDDSRPGYNLTTTDKPALELVISHRDLLMAIGGAVFDDQQIIVRSDVMQHCKIANDKNRNIVRSKFAKALEDHGFSELSLTDAFESIRDEFDEWVLVENSSELIIIVDKLSSVLDEYVAGMTSEEFVRKYLSPRVSRLPRDEFQERYSNRIRNR